MGRFAAKALLVVQLVFLPALAVDAASAATKNGFELEASLIPIDEIRRGGPPRDGIPAIYAPKFETAASQKDVAPEDRVLGVHVGGIAKAFPVDILDHHEVVNDWTQQTHMVITYCPLCGSGMAFHPGADGQAVFGVSGLLYNSDVLLYDHATESLWSQILGKAVTGPSRGQTLEQIPVVHTTWADWLERHPDTHVLSRETGYRGIRYGRSPYRGYERSSRIWFPVAARDTRYPSKAWVLGLVLDGVSRAYPFEELEKTGGVVRDTVGTTPITVRFDNGTAWAQSEDGSLLPAVRLFWFAWYGFHPDTEVFVAEPERP